MVDRPFIGRQIFIDLRDIWHMKYVATGNQRKCILS